jgi:cation diffusion facilitator family transporter
LSRSPSSTPAPNDAAEAGGGPPGSAAPVFRPATASEGSTRVIAVALAANLAIAAAKFVAAVVTGSSALVAEAFHSVADSGNEILLGVARVRGERTPDQRHPFGSGREAYFWALIAAVAVFVGGGLLSVRQGADELLHATKVSSFLAGYVVLAVAFTLDGISFLQAFKQLRAEARELGRDVGTHFELTSDPVTRAVFLEDAAALTGTTVAFVGLVLRQATHSHVPDALAAVAIGGILGFVAIQLAGRNRDFLVGEQAPDVLRDQVRRTILDQPGVVGVNELLVTFVGPRRVWVVSRVDVDDALRGDDVERLVRNTEGALLRVSPTIVRADIVTVGRVAAGGG